MASLPPIPSLSFAAISGQTKAKRIWQRIFSSGRLAHAYLFRGPDGVGKQLCAKVIAARLHCLQPTNDGGCGICTSCRKYAANNHPDITIINPEGGTIKIDRVRELRRSLAYAPYESEIRVIVIEDVHTMRVEAANCLLKTLEEPPKNNLLILTAESSREVLPTIVSRCQVIPFYGLSTNDTAAILSEFSDIEPKEAELLARLSEGSPGNALLFREKGLIDLWTSIQPILEQKPRQDDDAVQQIVQLAEQVAALKENILPLLGLIRLWVRDQMVGAGEADDTMIKDCEARLKALDQAQRQLARNCNRGLVCEVLLFNLQSPEPRVSL